METKAKDLTPILLLEQDHPSVTVQEIRKITKSWNRRWGAVIDWPITGSFDLQTLDNLQILISCYKAHEMNKTGRKALHRQGKIAKELAILKLFKNTAEKGQKKMEKQLKGDEANQRDNIRGAARLKQKDTSRARSSILGNRSSGTERDLDDQENQDQPRKHSKQNQIAGLQSGPQSIQTIRNALSIATDEPSQEIAPLNAVVRSNPRPQPNDNNKRDGVKTNKKGNSACFRCGSQTHWQRRCPDPKPQEGGCLTCRGRGLLTPAPRDGPNGQQFSPPDVKCPVCDGSGQKGVPRLSRQVGGNPGAAAISSDHPAPSTSLDTLDEPLGYTEVGIIWNTIDVDDSWTSSYTYPHHQHLPFII